MRRSLLARPVADPIRADPPPVAERARVPRPHRRTERQERSEQVEAGCVDDALSPRFDSALCGGTNNSDLRAEQVLEIRLSVGQPRFKIGRGLELVAVRKSSCVNPCCAIVTRPAAWQLAQSAATIAGFSSSGYARSACQYCSGIALSANPIACGTTARQTGKPIPHVVIDRLEPFGIVKNDVSSSRSATFMRRRALAKVGRRPQGLSTPAYRLPAARR